MLATLDFSKAFDVVCPYILLDLSRGTMVLDNFTQQLANYLFDCQAETQPKGTFSSSRSVLTVFLRCLFCSRFFFKALFQPYANAFHPSVQLRDIKHAFVALSNHLNQLYQFFFTSRPLEFPLNKRLFKSFTFHIREFSSNPRVQFVKNFYRPQGILVFFYPSLNFSKRCKPSISKALRRILVLKALFALN